MKIILTGATGFVGEGVLLNTLSQVGQAMLNATEKGYKQTSIEVKDINALNR